MDKNWLPSFSTIKNSLPALELLWPMLIYDSMLVRLLLPQLLLPYLWLASFNNSTKKEMCKNARSPVFDTNQSNWIRVIVHLLTEMSRIKLRDPRNKQIEVMHMLRRLTNQKIIFFRTFWRCWCSVFIRIFVKYAQYFSIWVKVRT